MAEKNDALLYHQQSPCGKISVVPTKPCESARDLSLAYTPGVAKPCLEIKDHPETVWDYTSKGNFVAVVSDGTAVLGLGNIGPEAGLPVMEGKAVLFKRFADIDAIGICLGKVFNEKGRTDSAKLIAAVETLEPSFGGINLEDIGSPACFEVETELKKRMNIPVFHDDQHGTAVITPDRESYTTFFNASRELTREAMLIYFEEVYRYQLAMSGFTLEDLYAELGVKDIRSAILQIEGIDVNDIIDQQFPEELLNLVFEASEEAYPFSVSDGDILISDDEGDTVFGYDPDTDTLTLDGTALIEMLGIGDVGLTYLFHREK